MAAWLRGWAIMAVAVLGAGALSAAPTVQSSASARQALRPVLQRGKVNGVIVGVDEGKTRDRPLELWVDALDPNARLALVLVSSGTEVNGERSREARKALRIGAYVEVFGRRTAQGLLAYRIQVVRKQALGRIAEIDLENSAFRLEGNEYEGWVDVGFATIRAGDEEIELRHLYRDDYVLIFGAPLEDYFLAAEVRLTDRFGNDLWYDDLASPWLGDRYYLRTMFYDDYWYRPWYGHYPYSVFNWSWDWWYPPIVVTRPRHRHKHKPHPPKPPTYPRPPKQSKPGRQDEAPWKKRPQPAAPPPPRPPSLQPQPPAPPAPRPSRPARHAPWKKYKSDPPTAPHTYPKAKPGTGPKPPPKAPPQVDKKTPRPKPPAKHPKAPWKKAKPKPEPPSAPKEEAPREKAPKVREKPHVSPPAVKSKPAPPSAPKSKPKPPSESRRGFARKRR